MVELMKSVMVDFGSTMANVIRQQFRQSSAPKARDELVEPSKKRALSPGSPQEGRAMDRGEQTPLALSPGSPRKWRAMVRRGQVPREMSKRTK